jgi:hypothetical protein
MTSNTKIPRIIEIKKLEDLTIQVMFNNGALKNLDFEKIFAFWQITKNDIEYPLLQEKEFKKVQLRNHTLS